MTPETAGDKWVERHRRLLSSPAMRVLILWLSLGRRI
jgi:hypothetical protein